MSEHNHIDPSPETLANRKAGMEMITEKAIRGDRLSLMALEMDSLAGKMGLFIDNGDYSDDDDGWDDIRPY